MLKLIPDEPALLLKTTSRRILLIADLHLGFERGLLSKGINIPSQTQKIYLKLKSIIDRFSLDSIIILGDIKHRATYVLPQEQMEIRLFFDKGKNLVKSIEIVRGNHDGSISNLIPKEVKIHPSRGISITNGKKNIALIHGHAWPSPKLFHCDVLIMAHNHPVIEFKEYGFRIVEPVWVRTRWNKRNMSKAFLKFSGKKVGKDPLDSFKEAFGFNIGDPNIIIMPAFNPLLGGNAINTNETHFLGPLLSSDCIDLKKLEIYLLDGSYLGHLSNLIPKD